MLLNDQLANLDASAAPLRSQVVSDLLVKKAHVRLLICINMVPEFVVTSWHFVWQFLSCWFKVDNLCGMCMMKFKLFI